MFYGISKCKKKDFILSNHLLIKASLPGKIILNYRHESSGDLF